MNDEALLTPVRARTRSIDSESELQTLINSLTLDQLRFALLRLAPGKKIPLRKFSDAFEALSKTGASVDRIAEELLHIEAISPAKHCLVCSCNVRVDDALFLSRAELKHGDLSFKISHSEDTGSTYSVTFSHTVPVKNWVEERPGHKSIQSIDIRHPIVVRYLRDCGAALFYYPGFFQGDGVKRSDRLAYDVVLSALMQAMESQLGLKFGVVPIERAIGVLSSGENSRIRVTKTDVEGGLGRIGVAARSQRHVSFSVEDVIANFVSPHLAGSVSADDIRSAVGKAFREVSANSLVVHWVREEVFSRINFWSIGAEFFFIWNKAGHSILSIEGVVRTLFEIGKQLVDLSSGGAWDDLAKLEPMAIVLPNNFAAKYSLSMDEASRFFVRAIGAGLVNAVYRVRTSEVLEETANDWTERLSSLRRVFHTLSGDSIDGGDPQMIEVAFQRVGRVGGGV